MPITDRTSVHLLRSERFAASLLLGAAALGLLLANTPLGPALLGIQGTHLGIFGFDLSVGHWISDGLLAIFFFIVAVELRQEMTTGDLSTFSRALHPAIAAIGGVAIPALVYLAFTAGSGQTQGWPVPTATDIAFAVGVLAMFGRGLPTRLRVFLLALAVLDDLIAIVIIAVFFTADPSLVMLGIAVIALIIFTLLGKLYTRRPSVLLAIALAVVAVITWALVYSSGVHATIAGVALGLLMPGAPAVRLVHKLEPFSNGLVLPLFAFSSTLVLIPQIPLGDLSSAFWGITVALPAGKLVGIVLGGLVGMLFVRRGSGSAVSLADLAIIGVLGGIGFTVSLLMTDLAFAGDALLRDEGILGVLLGSGISIVAAAIVLTVVSRRVRRRTAAAASGAPLS